MTKNKFITISLFILMVLLAIVTRGYKLGSAPAGIYLDEAGQGYSAYSIYKTGKDEFGKAYPIVFRSFTDFKTPVYIYLIVPLIPLFGLTKFTVRFPSFFFSILTFPVLYLLIKKLTPKKYANTLALLSCLLLAISPWHVLFGRTNFECNVALFFFLSGLLLFYQGLKNAKVLIVSAILFAIAIPAYHAQRIITPLTFIYLFIRYRKTLLDKNHIKSFIISLIVGFIILIPTLSVINTPGFLARASGLNIFTRSGESAPNYIQNCEGPTCLLLNSPILLSLQEFASLYTDYFSPRQMFILGDYGPRSSYPDLSTFYLWQFPFYLIGLFYFIKEKDLKEIRSLTLFLLIISPIPAAVTRDPYSSIRALQMVVPLTIIISFGIIKFYEFLRRPIFTKMAFLVFPFVIVYSIFRLWSSAIILNEFYRAGHWNYGWEEVSKIIMKQDPNIPVVVDNARNEPYIQLLFFTKFDPETYQKNNYEVSLSQYYTNMDRQKDKVIGNITTRSINWKKDLSKEQILVGDELAISLQQIEVHNLTLIDEVDYPDGTVAFRIVKTNP
jgi:4-amino-4-deoxy-L-arabinose transferase-like glycosyltransferase